MYVRRGVGTQRSSKWKSILIVLLFLVGLAAVGYFFLSEHIVFTADGMRITLFQPKEPQEDNTNDEVKIPPIVIEPTTPGGDTTQPTTPQQPGEQALTKLDAKRTEWAQIDAAQLAAQGISQVAITIKGTDGVVQIPLANPVGENSISPNAQENAQKLKELKEQGIAAVAVVSAFRDAIGPRAMRDAAVQTQDKYTWLDRDSISWFDPKNEKSIAYLADILNSLGELGVTEVVLTEFCYPFVGKTNLIGTAYRTENEAITAALESLKEQLTAPMSITVLLRPEAENVTGQNVAALEQAAQRIGVTPQQAESVKAQLSQEGNLVQADNQGILTIE